MNVSYGVRWREHDVDLPCRLVVAPDSIRLVALEEESDVIRELPFDEIRAISVHPSEAGPGHAIVVLESAVGGYVEIESAVDRWLVAELVHKVAVHGLGGAHGRDRLLVSVGLLPGSHEAVRALLEAGPPFDPSGTALAAHDVFLLENEAVFLFETDDREALAVQALRIRESATAWRAVMGGEIRLAEHAYSWTRSESSAPTEVHIGLGL